MSNSIILEAFWRVAQWGVARRFRQLSSHGAADGAKSLRSGE
jgi:hypothetical protein